MRRFVVLTALALVAATVWVLPAGAQVPPPHEHILVTPVGPVDVGPPRCGNDQLQRAFLNFHMNVHFGAPPTAITARRC